MFNPKSYYADVLHSDLSRDTLFRAGETHAAVEENGDVRITLNRLRQKRGRHITLELMDVELDGSNWLDDVETGERLHARVRFYSNGAVRLLISATDRPFDDDTPMLSFDERLDPVPCRLQPTDDGFEISDGSRVRMAWSREEFAPTLFPESPNAVNFQSRDYFLRGAYNALPVTLLQREDGSTVAGFTLEIRPEERLCGTGERFERLDLNGRVIEMVNVDAGGTSGAWAYKNVPFLMSSRRYGVFAHSSAKMRLDIGAFSNRSLQWFAEDDYLDLFFIPGETLQQVLYGYRQITGRVPMPPIWSFGVWMSRFTYWDDKQVKAIGERLRDEHYPADVLHIDTSWFPKNFRCDWTFSKERFPDPEGFFRDMQAQGFRISLWQCPYVNRDIPAWQEASKQGYIGKSPAKNPGYLGDTLDLTNPRATAWYQRQLARVLEAGAAVIKTDFGENVDEEATYEAMPASKYRNLYALLYQRAAWEITRDVKGEGLIWARAAWAGSQRYPVHWGGDCPSTFSGLGASVWGGMHLGLSGFAFWGHDVGGFYGYPDFTHSKPTESLYLRWTQVGVFSSHMRYHGCNPREPWEYPGVADAVREWWKLRYALLPYILDEARKCCDSGLPMLRALVIDWPDDPAAWAVSDQYLFGDAFLVCPVLNAEGVRNVYIPEGRWVNLWTGARVDGPRNLHDVALPGSRLPLYVRLDSHVTFAEPVNHTGELPDARKFTIAFDETYKGFDQSELAKWVRL